MEQLTILPSYELEEFLYELKPYQRDAITTLIDQFGEEEAAKMWLSANGPSDTQKFGGQQRIDSEPYWDRFMTEFRLFVCGDKKYKKDREKLLSATRPASIVVVSNISAVIGFTLGLAPAMLVPVVAIVLSTVGKVGVNAWCKCAENFGDNTSQSTPQRPAPLQQ